MIQKAIPTSFRAGIFLAIALLCFPAGLNELSILLTSESISFTQVVKAFGLLIVGGAAAVYFYYLQNKGSSSGELEILSEHHRRTAEESRIHTAQVSVPKFPDDK